MTSVEIDWWWKQLYQTILHVALKSFANIKENSTTTIYFNEFTKRRLSLTQGYVYRVPREDYTHN